MQRAGPHAEIVDIAAAAGQQRRVFDARHRTADPAFTLNVYQRDFLPKALWRAYRRVSRNQDRFAMPR